MTELAITVELSGGCELLFRKQQRLTVPAAAGTTLRGLVELLLRQHIAERPDHFGSVADGGASLRPGILALVNDCDHEVVGGMEYALCDGDTVAFISTLHGG